MPKREGAVHVATTERTYGGKVYRTHLLRRTYREGGKVKHVTLANISYLPEHVIELVRGALKGEAYLPAGSALEIKRSLPHGHVAAVLGTARKVGLDGIIASQPSRKRDLVLAMVAGRVLDPGSKLQTARSLDPRTATSTLGEVLGVAGADEDELYEAMDWLLQRQARIEGKLARRHLAGGSLVLYDISASYYTGSCCPLAQYGHAGRGKKKGFPQIKYGLLCNAHGCPVAVEVFQGNAADPTTLSSQIKKIRRRFGLERVVLVGDRGMITAARIEDELKPTQGLDWITALRAPQIRKLAEEGVVQPSLFDQRDLAEVTSPDYPGERLIACRNPYLAEERARTREELLQATEEKLAGVVEATRRQRRPLRGKENIALRVGKVIDKHKVGKHFRLTFSEDGFTYERDERKISEEAALDGIYVIRTSVRAEEFTPEGTVRAYKGLSAVEHAFRCLKSVDLRVEPVGHRRPDRVRAHIFLCMLAYYLEWHMRSALAPMLFDDEDWALAQSLRESAVSPAVRSPKAARKAARKVTEDGLPVHSFHSLLADLSTVAKNRVCASPSLRQARGVEFDLLTIPTPLQLKALDLLGVSLSL